VTVLPVWVRLADGLAVLLLGVAAWIALSGGGRVMIAGLVVSFRSAALFLFLAGGVLAVRHVLVPRPSALARLVALDAAINARPALAAALRAFLATRPLVLAVGLFAVLTFGIAPQAQDGLRVSNHPVVNLPARFDAGWYIGIALDGYSWEGNIARQQSIAFFPALPLLSRPVGALYGAYADGLPRSARMARLAWAGVTVALAAFLGGLYYFARLGEALVGRERAADATLLLAAYPFALFYSAPYTEALFLLGATGAAWHFLRRQWIAAAAWGLVVGLSRPNGFLLSLPLAILAWQLWRTGVPGRRARGAVAGAMAAATAPALGMLLFTGYLYSLTGLWFAWAQSHAAWGRSFAGLAPFSAAWNQLSQQPLIQVIGNAPYESLNAIGLVFALALLWPTIRHLGAAWGLFVAVSLLMPLLAGGVLSLGRLTSTLFPLFLALAVVLPRPAVPACAAAFALLQGLAAALFFTWRDLY
jgi:hypothetical protein